MEIESLFIIAGDQSDLVDSDTPATIGNLVRPDRHRKYRSFGQFKPVMQPGEEAWTWQTKNDQPAHPAIAIGPAGDDFRLEVSFGREVFDTHPQTCLVIICHYGGKDWRAEKLLGPELENSSELTIEVRSREMIRRVEP